MKNAVGNRAGKLVGIVLALCAIGATLFAISLAPTSATTSTKTTVDGLEVQHATGQIKAFGPAQTSASILHKSSHGSMGGLVTKSFTAKTATQLQDFVVDDRVRFSFTIDNDRATLVEITKQP